MMGIGFSELVVIVLVVLVFIKPEDLPAFFRKLGKIYAELKKGYDELTAVKDDFIREVEAAARIEEEAPAPAEAGTQASPTSPGGEAHGTQAGGAEGQGDGEGLAQSGKPL